MQNILRQVATNFVDRRTYSSRAKNSSGAFHHDGTTAWSYAEPIAVHISEGGKRKLLMTSRKFSRTTSKHQSAVRYAASQAGFEIVESPDSLKLPLNASHYFN